MDVQDMAAIRMAGFGIGTLPASPDELCVHHAGFSADASVLVAQAFVLGVDRLSFYHMECTVTGQHICLGPPQNSAPSENHEEIFIVGWLPGADTVLMQRDTTYATMPVLLSSLGCQKAPSSWSTAITSNNISPSSSFFLMALSQEEPAIRLAAVQSGQHLWEPRISDLDWPALHELLDDSAPHHFPEWLCCEAWAPTGVGPVYTSPGRDETADGGMYLPPTLHICMFA